MRTLLRSASTFTIVMLSYSARADAPWCHAPGASKFEVNDTDVKYALTKEDPADAIHAIVGTTCYGDADIEKRRGEIDAVRQKWSARLDMNEADWADAAAWASAPASDRGTGRVYVDAQGQELGIAVPIKRAWSSLGPVDQYAAIMNGLGNDSGNPSRDKHYITDAFGPQLTECGRVAYIQSCFSSDAKPVAWAMCQPDIAALDAKKVAGELRAEKTRTGFEKMVIRLALDSILHALPKRATDINRLAEKDPAYAKMFALAAMTYKDWTARWQKESALVELALAMDDARAKDSRKGFAGCDEKTWSAFSAAVAAIPAAQFAGKKDDIANPFLEQAVATVAGTPTGYLAATALYICATREGEKDLLAGSIGRVLQRWPGFRGPRNAIHTTILTAALELDERGAKIEYPEVYRERFNGQSSRSTTATVAALKPSGKTVRVEWAKQLAPQEQCAESRTTNRITQIRPDGTLIYQSICLKYKTIIVNNAPDPQTIDSKFAAHLKPGLNASIAGTVLVAAWAKGKSTPAVVLGVNVK